MDKPETLTVETPFGKLIASVMPDPEYPGITIDLEEPTTGVQIPIALVEHDMETKQLISRVWGNALQEDYTERVDHTNIPEAIELIRKECTPET